MDKLCTQFLLFIYLSEVSKLALLIMHFSTCQNRNYFNELMINKDILNFLYFLVNIYLQYEQRRETNLFFILIFEKISFQKIVPFGEVFPFTNKHTLDLSI